MVLYEKRFAHYVLVLFHFIKKMFSLNLLCFDLKMQSIWQVHAPAF